MNISGNFNTLEREIDIVKQILNIEKIPYIRVEKFGNPNDGDILVVFKNGKNVLIEVKEEKIKRFEKYGDLGIDYISTFYFKNRFDESNWKGLHNPSEHERFIETIDTKKNFKPGKLTYSKSDLWLFFVVDDYGELFYYNFFDGIEMTSENFKHYLKENCKFAVNNKSSNQLSCYDNYQSACFFINHNDSVLKKFIRDIKDYT